MQQANTYHQLNTTYIAQHYPQSRKGLGSGITLIASHISKKGWVQGLCSIFMLITAIKRQVEVTFGGLSPSQQSTIHLALATRPPPTNHPPSGTP